MSPESTPRIPHAGVRFPPPLLFVGGFLLGWLLHRWYPLSMPGGRGALSSGLGWLVVALGFGLMLWALATFRHHRTAVIPDRPASLVVTDGPYSFTRNPMYLGFTIAYVGGVLVTGMLWPLALLPVVLVLLTSLVISREERYMADAFGVDYDAYRARVRRWV